MNSIHSSTPAGGKSSLNHAEHPKNNAATKARLRHRAICVQFLFFSFFIISPFLENLIRIHSPDFSPPLLNFHPPDGEGPQDGRVFQEKIGTSEGAYETDKSLLA
jgi:hypothetical protein